VSDPSWYERHVVPRLLDWTMRQVNDERTATLADARGEVLEVGFGTGLNLRYYPAGVTRLVTVDPLVGLDERVQARIAAAPFPVERHRLRAEGGLPFAAARFDRVVMTWTLCSIAQPEPALAEMRRVLRPDGRLLFIEHGLAEEASLARWQRRITPLWKRVSGGCHLDRPIDRLIESGGFHCEKLERFRHPQIPGIVAPLYRGTALPR
jgi:ubiquinone/menaquinone biosynthesis C-methylase UbiE